jgi:uncharacterized protein YutD
LDCFEEELNQNRFSDFVEKNVFVVGAGRGWHRCGGGLPNLSLNGFGSDSHPQSSHLQIPW